MLKLVITFLGGIVYGAIVSVEVPDGAIAKAAMLIKMIFWG